MFRLFAQRISPFRKLHSSQLAKMPMVNVVTNIPDAQVPLQFEKDLTHLLAESMGKPASRIAVTVFAGSRMVHGASTDPVVVISIRSIGAVGPEENIRHTEKITKLCNDTLKLPNDKVVIEYFNLTPETVGFNGTTVANANK